MMMTDQKIKVVRLQKLMFNSAQHQRRISLAHLRHQHADRLTPSIAQRPGKQIWPVVQPLRSSQNTVLSLLGNGARRRSCTENPGNCGHGQPQMVGQHLKAYRLRLSLRRSGCGCGYSRASGHPCSLSQKNITTEINPTYLDTSFVKEAVFPTRQSIA